MAYRTTKKYEKNETIILAFDIGTTHTYQNGEAQYFGAEAREYIDEDEYEIARWFKLHLHPDSMKFGQLSELEIPSLPSGVSLPQVYADFIRYIYNGTKEFFISNTPNGQHIWSRLKDQMPIIFCTPNGWDMSEHAFLTQAAIQAGITDPSNAEDRLWFLTEGEASVHYSLAHTKTAEWLKMDTIFAVTDAGGSTVDSTLYCCRRESPLVLEEVCASACVQAGGVYVDRAVEDLLKHKLANSNYGDEETISLMVRQFEQKTKRTFDGSQTSNIIHFGTPRDNDKNHGIVKGKLTLGRDDVGAAYTRVISNITESCRTLLGNRNVQHLLLVGGFGESPYLRQQLKNIFDERRTQVVTIDEPSKKAAADGAVIWYLTQLVEARAARFDYGIICAENYDRNLHVRFEDKRFVSQDGIEIFWKFNVLIPKDTIFTHQWSLAFEGRRGFTEQPTATSLGNCGMEVFVWRGSGPRPYALDPITSNPYLGSKPISGLDSHFSVRADLRALAGSIESGWNQRTEMPFWFVQHTLDLYFRDMKLSARLRWEEKGVERTGPATIIPVTKL
ncbi:hypothetical protein FRC17_001477 [Serendipita sp. 399]|nr:hypothetical protein FRC17_001477 [Serendipita sp. 399]